MQVSFSSPHAVPYKLFTFHAILRLHIQHYGQVVWRAVWELTEGNRGDTWPCSSHTYDQLAVGLSSKDRIRLHSIQTLWQLRVVYVDVVALGMAVNGSSMDLWVICIRGWENQTEEDEDANMGCTEIQLPSNQLPLPQMCLSNGWQVALPHFSFFLQYGLTWDKESINDLIEKAILDADVRGVKVLPVR